MIIDDRTVSLLYACGGSFCVFAAVLSWGDVGGNLVCAVNAGIAALNFAMFYRNENDRALDILMKEEP